MFLFSYLITFLHYEYSSLREWDSYVKHKKEYKKIIKNSEYEIDLIVKELKDNGLDKYAVDIEKTITNKKENLKEYTVKKKELASQFSYLGYSSRKVFLYDFGKSIFCVSPLILLLTLILNPELINKLNRFLVFGILGLFYVAFFWVIHSVFALTDFGSSVYRFSYVIGSVLSTFITYLVFIFFSKVEKRKEETKRQNKIFIENSLLALDELKAKIN